MRLISFGTILSFCAVALGATPNLYYRLTNDFNGPNWALDVADNAGGLKIAPAGDFSGQYWRLVPTTEDPNKYRLQTLFRGPGLSLDIGPNRVPRLATTAFVSGQFWTLTKVNAAGTTFKLSNDFTGTANFLDVFSNLNQPTIAAGDTTGMHWTLTLARIGD